MAYKTKFNWVGADWKRVKNHCRTTDNKEFTDKEPSVKFKKQLLISEHSPIRLLEVDWSWEDIYSWVATHWSRHKFEKFISTQRDDRFDEMPMIDKDDPWTDYWDAVDKYIEKHGKLPRGKKLQEAPVKFDGYANAQNLIDSFRKRLCVGCVSPETRELAEDFKCALHETQPEIANVLVPNCIYRCGCPEFKTCGYFSHFIDRASAAYCLGFDTPEDVINALMDIQTRYDLYNSYFYGRILE